MDFQALANSFLFWLIVTTLAAYASRIIWVDIKVRKAVKGIANMIEKAEGVEKEVNILLEMHNHPDDYEFGTKGTNTLLTKLVTVAEENGRSFAKLGTQFELLNQFLRKNGHKL